MFAVNGAVRVAYDDLGPPGGEPILLMMGLAASRFWWPPGLLDALQRNGFRPAVLDLRDAGESTRVPRGYTAEDLTDDVIAVADHLGLAAAHVFGLSFGGVVAQRVALRHPGRVRTVTCFAAGSSDAGLARVVLRYLRWSTQLRMLRRTRRNGTDEERAVALFRIAGYPGGDDFARTAVARDREHGIRSMQDTAAQRRQMGARWHGPRLSRMRVPALVMCGDADPVLHTRASRETAAAIPGARLSILPGVGHVPSPGSWDTIATAVRDLH
ncbi:alpha/beta fold hydrolase [Actinoplanes sp. URMC 104]|uniref:alpha/beta fold hydrolase n=1 Tax=Actinoplanes sp. URMC 104 TaxID=3423409 RepID=UPI003F19471D